MKFWVTGRKLEPSGSISRVLRTIFRKSFKPHAHNWKSLTDRDQLMIWREFKVYIYYYLTFLHVLFILLFTDEIFLNYNCRKFIGGHSPRRRSKGCSTNMLPVGIKTPCTRSKING